MDKLPKCYICRLLTLGGGSFMDKRQYDLWSRITALVVFAIATLTYVLTIEPTASFWDCGEFIASSYKLEVGHAPGNPVFQLIARFFTMFAGPDNAAVAVNVMSALCSSLTILFLFLTIAHLGRRLVEKTGGEVLSLRNTILVLGSAVVGSLAYCWSDTFWFSAVEGEVYAMSSLFTAVVFWAILKWEEEAGNEYAGRWIILIAFLMGLSIGVHLLNLLVIPAIAFIIYYKKAKNITVWGGIKVLVISGVILGFILWGVIPVLPAVAARVDLLFVNVFGLPFNSGAAVFMVVLLAACFLADKLTRKKGKVLLNTCFLCFTMIVIGYSTFAVVVIRSANNTPTNEYQPDNPFTLVRYLAREQYGSAPILYGETFASVPVDYDNSTYYTPLNGKYHKAPGAISYVYPSSSKMLFPRMWSRGSGETYINFYKRYTSGKGPKAEGGEYAMPTFGENIAYFLDYQVGWMYFRYFLWNFAGRQNDIHGPVPGDPLKGNWETGIGFYDRWRLGDQSEGPDYYVHNKAKNHFYMLPLLLGLIGMFYQLKRDQRNWWVTMLLFLLTGLAIIVYLNQTPFQVRERDYAYAGSFYMFTVWIGLAVMAVEEWIREGFGKKGKEWIPALVSSLLLLIVPLQMVSQTWDDHDRSNRYTSRDLAYNYFMSCDSNAVIVTHGDNDTFPLWYIQEVEGVRTDCRVVNTSLLGTDWYIDQIRKKQYECDPVRLSVSRENYLYGTNEWIPVQERAVRPLTVREAMDIFNNPKIKMKQYGESVDFFPTFKVRLPVNKENVKKYGIVAEEDYDKILDTLELVIPKEHVHLSKPELITLDMFANYDWERPLYFLSLGGDLNVGLRPYLQYDGFAYKFVPIRSKTTNVEVGQIDSKKMYDKVMNVWKWDSFNKEYYSDYQNMSTFTGTVNVRNVFIQTAVALYGKGETAKVTDVLDRMQEFILPENVPLNATVLFSGSSLNEYMLITAIELYFKCGEDVKGKELADRFLDEALKCMKLSAQEYLGGLMDKSTLETNYQLYYYVVDILKEYAPDMAQEKENILSELLKSIS